MARLHLVCGPIGAGKSTKALEIADMTGAAIMSPDLWMRSANISIRNSDARQNIEDAQLSLARLILRQGQDVVIEWGMWGRDERGSIASIVINDGHQVTASFLVPELSILRERISLRDAQITESDRPSVEEINLSYKLFEMPETDELSKYVSYSISQ